jgi:hypothetical protein
LPKL